MFQVKLVSGKYDGTSLITPDSSFDQSRGYYTGYALLVEDGTSWICEDATIGMALWNPDTSKDQEIMMVARSLTDRLIRYLYSASLQRDSMVVTNGLTFGVAGLLTDENDALGFFYEGDTLHISGSTRNDGLYDVLEVTPSTMRLEPGFNVQHKDEVYVSLTASIFPSGLSLIASRMASYDLWFRGSPGLGSESIGSYSYTKATVEVGGVGYPADVVAGLLTYKRPKIR